MSATRRGIGVLPMLKRRRFAAAASVTGASLAALLLAAGPAAAATPPSNVNYPAPAQNSVIVGSGSNTAYFVMQSLDQIFNEAPGCVITSGSVVGATSKHYQQLDFSCEESTGATGAPTAGTTLEQVPGNYSFEDNPINDASVQEPPLGSGPGIAQLELDRNQSNTAIGNDFTGTASGGTCTGTPPPETSSGSGEDTDCENVSVINYARSSRDPSTSSDVQGLNFVAYAKDSVAPLYFSKTNGAKTDAGGISGGLNLSSAQLLGIWEGTIYDWAQLGAKKTAPIFVYSAQEGSGTQSTFKTFLDGVSGAPSGFDPSATTNAVNCTDPAAAGDKPSGTTGYYAPGAKTATAWPATLSTGCKGPDVIFESEDGSILANASSSTRDAVASGWMTDNSGGDPVADSIFFYSAGKFAYQCEGIKEQITYANSSGGGRTEPYDYKAGTFCGTDSTGYTDKDTLELASVNGVTADPESTLGSEGTAFPITRYLYNVYANGYNANIPEATPATLNYVSEVGFICKSQTTDGATATSNLPASTYTQTAESTASDGGTGQYIVDPLTGLWYHDEIFNAIVANGFIPLGANVGPTYATITDGPAFAEDTGVPSAVQAENLLSSGGYGSTYLTAGSGGTNGSIATSSPDGYCLVSDTDGNTNS